MSPQYQTKDVDKAGQNPVGQLDLPLGEEGRRGSSLFRLVTGLFLLLLVVLHHFVMSVILELAVSLYRSRYFSFGPEGEKRFTSEARRSDVSTLRGTSERGPLRAYKDLREPGLNRIPANMLHM